MEEDNRLELSLGLSCGGSLVKDKGKSVCSGDVGTEETDRGSKIIDDFKNFLQGGNQRQDMSPGLLRSDSMKVKENFFNDLSRAHIDGYNSMNLKATGVWAMKNENRVDIQEEKQPEVGNKRKILFEEINGQKKLEGESCQNNVEKAKTSFFSTYEDGSAAEIEDVGESELEGSTSKPVSQNDGHSELSTTDLSGQKKFNSSSSSDLERHNLNRSVPFSIQTTSMRNGIYPSIVKESHDAGGSSSTGHSLHGTRQVFLSGSGVQCEVQPMNPGNLPLMFGYSSSQLPTLDKDNSWGLISQAQLHNPCSRGQTSSGILPNSAEATPYDARTFEQDKTDSKQPIVEEGSSSQAGEKGSSGSHGAKDAFERSAGGLLNEISAIRPGLAADVKFGGCGSFPNLPWVSTTGPGPNGRTISGVTYRYNANLIKIVCACHGVHMSPEDFVRHAGEECVGSENETGLAPFSNNNNPSSSAQN
ncbi:ninja-family protein mc410-like isoform X1 [Cucurbita pepo subsp. pepo]|uniref:ninja-family protein mc410-like isoform X1 n=1 Tax=Cucurbita pepo subsp. pepo TaxID=3664 RepID=UPI000C9DA652|nr:ninja-family protein mc410-like isoform X1 [Cucurbita pepo subsp. pepo]XP_023530654.1 ninja-family protein mc410-like isoform X1 [Cucurbita pepo subsp. pepo]